MSSSFVAPVNDPDGGLTAFLHSFQSGGNNAAKGRGRFVLNVASTATSDIQGISAAGANAHMRRLTPSADAEALILGRTANGQALPVSPEGIVSPVVITRASLSFLQCDVTVIDCGSFYPPAVPCITAGSTPARCLSTGSALELAHVDMLFRTGLDLGVQVSKDVSYLILSECVPGGTTTALGVLTALGYEVDKLLSSSLPHGNRDFRYRLVCQGLACAEHDTRQANALPLKAVAAVGDPMQPVVAGMALAASQYVPVMLAGGSQMLAVWALVASMAHAEGFRLNSAMLGVVTTKWVAFDPWAGCRSLSQLVNAPFAASCPDFCKSRHPGLRSYEEGHVKEGVGAGGSMAAARLVGQASSHEILQAVDSTYDELVLGL